MVGWLCSGVSGIWVAFFTFLGVPDFGFCFPLGFLVLGVVAGQGWSPLVLVLFAGFTASLFIGSFSLRLVGHIGCELGLVSHSLCPPTPGCDLFTLFKGVLIIGLFGRTGGHRVCGSSFSHSLCPPST